MLLQTPNKLQQIHNQIKNYFLTSFSHCHINQKNDIMGLFGFKKKEKSPFEIIKEKLHSEFYEAKFSGNWKLRQEIQLKLKWLETVKNQNKVWDEMLKEIFPKDLLNISDSMDVSKMDTDEFIFPQELNDQEMLHYKFSETIYKDYAKVIADSGKYHDCLYKPASMLPYPKEYIAKTIQFTINCLHIENPFFVTPTNKDEIISRLKVILVNLPMFINANEKELPSERMENLMKGNELRK